MDGSWGIRPFVYGFLFNGKYRSLELILPALADASQPPQTPPQPQQQQQQLFVIKLDRHTSAVTVAQAEASPPPTPSPSQKIHRSDSSQQHQQQVQRRRGPPDEHTRQRHRPAVLAEVRATFSPELAHMAYTPLCRLAGK